MKLDILDCFCTADEFSGNRAAVITNFSGGKVEKQKLALELNLPVTVYISKRDADIPLLEYFYPDSEMPLCLHGTIAAGEVLMQGKEEESCTFITTSQYPLSVTKCGSLIQVEVSQQASPLISIEKFTVCQMLNLLDESLLDMPVSFTISSVGSPKLFVPIKSKEQLLNLNPNFSLIKKWSVENQINGLFVYSSESSENDFVARAFNPKTGHNEDAATGVAAAALALLLKKTLVIAQGENLGTPCKILTTYIDDKHILVGGNVILRKSR